MSCQKLWPRRGSSLPVAVVFLMWVLAASQGQAAEEGTFTGTWIVSGQRFKFTWTSVFIDPDTDNLTAHTENIEGSYRIP
jgi:hypothetical protein